MDEAPHRRSLGHSLNEAGKAVGCIIGPAGLLLMLGFLPYCNHLIFGEPSKSNRARQDLQALESALKQYTQRTGHLPKEGGWPVLVKASLLEREPVDPWGNAYLLSVTEDGKAEVTSLGADGQPGGKGSDEDLVHGFQFVTSPR